MLAILHSKEKDIESTVMALLLIYTNIADKAEQIGRGHVAKKIRRIAMQTIDHVDPIDDLTALPRLSAMVTELQLRRQGSQTAQLDASNVQSSRSHDRKIDAMEDLTVIADRLHNGLGRVSDFILEHMPRCYDWIPRKEMDRHPDYCLVCKWPHRTEIESRIAVGRSLNEAIRDMHGNGTPPPFSRYSLNRHLWWSRRKEHAA